jgi:hypothetical protein
VENFSVRVHCAACDPHPTALIHPSLPKVNINYL